MAEFFRESEIPKAHPELHPVAEMIERLLFWVPGIKKITRLEE